MKKLIFITFITAMVFSCAPVIKKDLMDKATINVSITKIQKNPELYKGKLYIIGGIIVHTKVMEKGSLIEAVHVPVDSRGDLKDVKLSEGRFLAIYPKENGILDPLIYKKEREITIAGEFIGIEIGKINDFNYTYPLFEIKDIYLWEEKKEVYYMEPYYSPWYYYPYPSYRYWW